MSQLVDVTVEMYRYVLHCRNWSSDRYTNTSLKFTISGYAGNKTGFSTAQFMLQLPSSSRRHCSPNFKANRDIQNHQCLRINIFLLFLGDKDVLTVGVCQFTVFDFQLVQYPSLVCKVFKAPPTNISVTWHLIILNVGAPWRFQSALWYIFDSGLGKACFLPSLYQGVIHIISIPICTISNLAVLTNECCFFSIQSQFPAMKPLTVHDLSYTPKVLHSQLFSSFMKSKMLSVKYILVSTASYVLPRH